MKNKNLFKNITCYFVIFFMVYPTYLQAANTLLQLPPFTKIDPAPNVFFMLDDSTSMGSHRLPLPNGVTLPTTSTVTISGNTVDTQDEWALRSPTLNPLWYNPAIKYVPWNYDNDPINNFPNASIGGTDHGSASSKPDNTQLTERDMRIKPGTSTRITAEAGRGLLGEATNPADQTTGREVKDSSNKVMFRYWGMPLEFGTAPVDNTQITATDAKPLDLFIRPASAVPGGICTQWKRTNCSNIQEYTSIQPVPLSFTCSADSYTIIPCTGPPTQSSTCPSPQLCNEWRRADCLGTTITTYSSYPGNLQCYGQYQCSGELIKKPSPFSPSTVICGEAQKYSQFPFFAPLSQRQSTCLKPLKYWTCSAYAPLLTPARYYKFTGNVNSNSDKANPGKYELIEINRNTVNAKYRVVDAATGISRDRKAKDPSNPQPYECTALGTDGKWCTWQEEAQNFANWYTYYRNRLFSAIAVTSQALSDFETPLLQSLRIGYGRINYFNNAPDPWNVTGKITISSSANLDGFSPHPGALERGVRPFIAGTAERKAFFNWLFGLGWVGSTPNREAIDAIGRYLTYSDNKGPWGAKPGTNTTTPQLACRRNYALLATDGEWTNVDGGRQPLISNAGPSGLSTEGNPTNADGVDGPEITGDDVGETYQYKPSNYLQFSAIKTGTNQQRTLSDVTMYYFNRDLRPTLPNVIDPIKEVNRYNPAFWQSLSTYIIGYGLYASMDTPANRAKLTSQTIPGSAINWPRVEGVDNITFNSANGAERVNDTFRAAMNSYGNFYTAFDPVSLKNKIIQTFKDVTAQTGSAGGVAVTGAAVTADDLVFVPSYTSGKWTGQLQGYKPSDIPNLSNATPPAPTWKAVLPVNIADRKIYTRESSTSVVKEFKNASELSSQQQVALASTSPTATAQQMINYLRGDTSLAGSRVRGVEPDNSLSLGDFVNSPPLYSKAPDFGYSVMLSGGIPAGSYSNFVQDKKNNRTAAVYIGGNAGMLHAFKVEKASGGGYVSKGQELFAYVPKSVYAQLNRLANPEYDHAYFVDGPLVQGDAYLGGNWKSILVGTTGAGPASIFAIDITKPNSMNEDSFLWEKTAEDSEYIGNILGTGVIGRVKTAANTFKWVYIVGNGVESTSNRAALLVFDLANGNLLQAIPVGDLWDATATDAEAKRNGMGGVVATYDGEKNIKYVYGGDKQGNLWKFDFSSNAIPTTPTGFGTGSGSGVGRALFSASSSTNQAQPISAAPRVLVHPKGGNYIIFGTGKLYDAEDPADTKVQAIYGIWDNPEASAKITTSDLETVTIQANDTFDISNINWSSRRGWVLKLQQATGERIIADPSLAFGVLTLISFAPLGSGNQCVGGGISNSYQITIANGKGRVVDHAGVAGKPTPYLQNLEGSVDTETTMSKNTLKNALKNNKACDQKYTTGAPTIKGGATAIDAQCPPASLIRTWRQPLR